MKEITVISGKGGTGKTSLVGSFAALAKQKALLVDADVDAANLSLILRPVLQETHEFRASRQADIDMEKCRQCGLCLELCRFEAVFRDYRRNSHAATDTGCFQKDGKGSNIPLVLHAQRACRRPETERMQYEDQCRPYIFKIDPINCEGCGVCARACPNGAISMHEKLSGHWYISKTAYGTLVHARLGVAEENSGKLVTTVRNKAVELAAAEGKETLVIDGPPGIGCPVIASLAGVGAALIVTEPTVSGIHDLERVLAVCRHFQVPAAVCINRFDLDENYTGVIEEYCRKEDLPLAGKIPFDRAVIEAVVRGQPVVEYTDNPVSRMIGEVWERVAALD